MNLSRKDKQFLDWLADRLVNVYHESEFTSFVIRLGELARRPDVPGHRYLTCQDCGGLGRIPGTNFTCQTCNGFGSVPFTGKEEA